MTRRGSRESKRLRAGNGSNFPLASLSRGAEEDLGVPTKRNPARAFLACKPNPLKYIQIAISPYVAESLTILFPGWRRVRIRAFGGWQRPPPFLNEFRRIPLTVRVSRFFYLSVICDADCRTGKRAGRNAPGGSGFLSFFEKPECGVIAERRVLVALGPDGLGGRLVFPRRG